MSAEENIKKHNIILPKAPDPVGAYVAAKKNWKPNFYIWSSFFRP